MVRVFSCFLVSILAIGCGTESNLASGVSSIKNSLETYTVTATPLNESVMLKSPKAISLSNTGDIYIADMGYKKPLTVLDNAGRLVYRFGEKGSGPGQIGTIREVFAPTENNDSVYVVEYDKRAVFVYLDSTFVRQYSIPGEGYPRSSVLTESGSIMLGYANSNTQAREIDISTGEWLDYNRIYTYPASAYEGVPEGAGMNLFKGYTLKGRDGSSVYVFAMNTDALQIYNDDSLRYIYGPSGYEPNYENDLSSKPSNRFRAFGMPLSEFHENIYVGYSGEFKDKNNKEYYQSSSILRFNKEKGNFDGRLLIEPKVRWNYGIMDKGNRKMLLVDNNFSREGASVYVVDISSTKFFK